MSPLSEGAFLYALRQSITEGGELPTLSGDVNRRSGLAPAV